jgi:Phage-related minor tail protein
VISSLEVGSVFRIVDEASPSLKLITDQLKLLTEQAEAAKKALTSISKTSFKGLLDQVGNVSKSVTGIGESATKTAGAVDAAATQMIASLGRVAAVANDTRMLPGGGPGRRPSGSGGGGGAGGSSSFNNWLYGTPGITQTAHTEGGQRFHMPLGPVGMGMAAIGFGAFEEMELEGKIANMFASSGIAKPGVKMTDDPRFLQIRSQILAAYALSGKPLGDIEDAYVEGVRLSSPLPMEQRLHMLAGVLPQSMLESQLKGQTTVDEATKTMIQYAHQMGKYDDASMEKFAEHFAYLSTTTDATLSQATRASSYVIPMLRTMGFDPLQLVSMQTAMQRAGITSTKSGTWLENMFQRSFPGNLPDNPSSMQRRAFGQHISDMQTLGLLDKDEKQTFLDEQGRPDVFKFMGIIGNKIRTMSPNDEQAIFKRLYGLQGEKAAAFFADATTQQVMDMAKGDEKKFMTGADAWKWQQENNPMVEMRRTWAEINTQLIDIGKNSLPVVAEGLKLLNDALKSIRWLYDLLSGGNGGPLAQAAAQAYSNGIFGDQSNAGLNSPIMRGLRSGYNWLTGGGGSGSSGGGIGPSGLGPGSGGRGAGASSGIDYRATSMLAAGFTQEQWDAYRAGIRDIEGGDYGKMGGAGGLFAGAYQMGQSEIATSAAELGVASAGFLAHPELQEKLFEQYTLDHYKLLMRDPAFAALSTKDKLIVLATGQLGEDAASKYLHGSVVKDGWGTQSSAWANAVRSRLESADRAAAAPFSAPGGLDAAYHTQSGDDMDPSIHARGKEIHVHTSLIVDGKRLAQNTQKHIVRRNQFVYGPSGYDGAALPSGVDHGMASAVAA